MSRFPWLAQELGLLLLEIQEAKDDGSFWREERDVDYPEPPDYCGAFFGGEGGE
jgi:hypothetical protein